LATDLRIQHVSFPILKFDKTPDGDLVVYGKCTDGTVDADHQIVDPGWSARELKKWLSTGGNMRVQHSPFLYPAGKGLALELDKDGQGGHYLKALVCETNAKNLVEKGVLRDFSIGILDPQIVFKSRIAPGGTICGGSIGEVSLVDRGSNKNTTFEIAKSIEGGGVRLVAKTVSLSPMARVALGKKKKIVDSSGRDVSDVPPGDFAGPNHTFPIKGPADVPDAASLAHHADDPGAVRSRIRSIAHRKFGMEDSDLPPSLQNKPSNKARMKPCPACSGPDSDCEKCGGKGMVLKAVKVPDGMKPCPTCHGDGKILEGHRDCPDCENGFVKKTAKPGVIKSDAADDAPGDEGDDDGTIADYDADTDAAGDDSDDDADDGSSEGDGDDKSTSGSKKKQKLPKSLRLALKAQKNALQAAARGDNGGNTPAGVRGKPDRDAAESGYGTAKDKTMKPAGKHREPDGAQVEGVEHDASMNSTTEPGDETGVPGSSWGVTKSAPSDGMRRLHDLTCPGHKWKLVRKAYGVTDVVSALPVQEIQSVAIEAITKGRADEAAYFTDVLRTIGEMQSIGPDTLLDARKAFPELFPNTKPTQQSNIKPTQFRRGYQSAGRPSLSAGSESGHSSLPNATVHSVSASDFQRGYIQSGRANSSPGEGRQATAGTAAFGQAINSLAQLHQSVRALWPDMCPINVSLQDYTAAEGQTGIKPGQRPTFAMAPGQTKSIETDAERKLRKKLAKAEILNKSLAAENAALGALPDPEQAPYRGLPILDGPVDRDSFVAKSIGTGGADEGGSEDAEFLAFVNGLAASGDPGLRLNATKMLTTLLTK